jgi:RNA cap guanine-N2 methyltransferase
MEPYNLEKIYTAFAGRLCNDLALFLPRNSDIRQIALLGDSHPVRPGVKPEVVQYCMEGASKVSFTLGTFDQCTKYF